MPKLSHIVLLLLLALLAAACNLNTQPEEQLVMLQADTPTGEPTDGAQAQSSPLPTLTPSRTLRPPPTLEPPTLTLTVTTTPAPTETPTLNLAVEIPGLRGLETATPTGTPGCEPRADWQLTYEIQPNDALATIAQRYGTYVNALAEANCIDDPNVIRAGQQIRVPGAAHPNQPRFECIPYTILTPFDGTNSVPETGSIVFNWVGPRVPVTLIRIYRPGKDGVLDGSQVEITVELRQNETVNLAEVLPEGGTYTWELYPLDEGYRQIDCAKGGPWRFTKPQSPPLTATPDLTGGP